MASSPITILFVLASLSAAAAAAGTHRRPDLLFAEDAATATHTPNPTTFFEVTRPIPTPKTPPCSTLLLQHDFAFTYGRPPVTAAYNPPTHCSPHPPSLIVLEWSATSTGRQFDRIFGVWLGGAELLRSCTAEPRPTGILWSVRKDVTRYASLFSQPQTLAVYLGNLVDNTYTGVYHVNLTLHLYHSNPQSQPHPAADLILPISRPIPPNDGLWFQIHSSADPQSTPLSIPRNAYRAVLELYVSFHSSDEFWYTNPPNAYISANNLTIPGNGPFREVTATLDGDILGAVWPFPVIFTGGINPLLWRPISAIGSFDLPSYNIDITPFLGKLLDGKHHQFGFAVTNALDYWYVDANLHLWLDRKSEQTEGKLISYNAPNSSQSLESKFHGLDGEFRTETRRQISATGWVKSSHGKVTTHFFQSLDYTNLMKFEQDGNVQVINQSINFNYGSYSKNPSAVLYSEQVFQNFPLYIYTGTADQVNDSYSLVTNISLGFNTKGFSGERSGFSSYSNVTNLQDAEGYMRVKGNLVTGGLGSTRQVYLYESTDGCYFRNVSSSNYTILSDKSGDYCTVSSPQLFAGRMPFPARRASLDMSKLENGV